MASTFNIGQELFIGMKFENKNVVKNTLQQYATKVHQTFKVLESKSQKYVVCCPNRSDDILCPFYMRPIVSKKNLYAKSYGVGGTTHMFEYEYNTRL